MTDKKRWTRRTSSSNKAVVATVRMSQDLSDRVDACTFIEERTRSDLFRLWIIQGVEQAEKKMKSL